MDGRKSEIFAEFKELAEIDSVSFFERKMADRLTEKLKEIGLEVKEDNAGSHYGGNAGNLYAYLDGDKSLEPVLFAAHMDTVDPGIGKKVLIDENERISSDGTTVLGSDDVAGIVGILQGVRDVLALGAKHRPVEILFPIGEELYNRGSLVLDYSLLKSKIAYVPDMSGPVGSAANQAPTIISFEVKVKGKASHAGFAPEEGIHSIALISKGIADLRQGHLDEETTLNIGCISGGVATNIVPEEAKCTGEIRSYDHNKALEAVKYVRDTFNKALESSGAELEVTSEVKTKAYKIAEDSPTIRKFKNACNKLGFEGNIVSTFGGSDNNNFANHGIDGIVLSCGMSQVHSTKEYVYLHDIVNLADLVKELILDTSEKLDK